MNHWPYIQAAYAIVALGTIGVTAWAYLAMRRADGRADRL
jgi:hypothetical protein